MLKRSNIVSPQEELDGFYDSLRGKNLTPAWLTDNTGPAPRTKAVPFVWHWKDLRPEAMRAAELVGTEQAERRVLRMSNPGLQSGSAANTLVANIQIVMPGEIARAHRHTPSALRLIIEAEGGYTVVNGDRIPMAPGDLVLTPNWTWHDHANDTNQPLIWLDGLDSPLIRMLEANFYEQYPEESQPAGEGADGNVSLHGAGGLKPAWESADSSKASPLWHYPFAQARDALDRLAATQSGSAYDGVILEYTNPATGGPAMPTIASYIQVLRPGQRTAAHRHVCCTNYHVIEGEGYSVVGDQRLDWEDKDTFVVPTWTSHEHVNASNRNAYLFSFTDAPVMKALELYREEPAG